jgi:hypothetical protein
MRKNKTTISKATTLSEIAEFWDTHSLADYWEQTKPVEFKVDIRSEVTYYPVAQNLDAKIRKLAKRQGISPETLLNIWVQEKLHKA